MAYERLGENPLDYHQCRYGHSKLLFRGPKRDTKGKYVAFIGGTETYGKYIPSPFPRIIENEIGSPCVNLGAVNGGVDAFINDGSVLSVCQGAQATVVQVMGANNMSNRFYAVHPRRNDRFLKASTLLQAIYRDVDFTEFSFTRHLLSTLQALSLKKFKVIEQELKKAWVSRMELMLNKISGRVILLWVADRKPSDRNGDAGHSRDPLFVDQNMIARLSEKVNRYVEIQVPAVMAERKEGMLYPSLEAGAADQMYGPVVHQHIADQVLAALL